MTILVGILVLAVPLAAIVAVAALVDRRRARRADAVVRQIALTDALHRRLGGVVAPVVQRRRGRWAITVAVPFERPAIVAGVLAAVTERFDGGAYEVVLQRQAPARPARRARRPAPLGEESVSWT